MLDYTLRLGLFETQFWEMTLGEVSRWLNAVRKRKEDERREKAVFDYTQMLVLGSILGSMFDNKTKVPSIEEAYGFVFEEEEKEKEEKVHTVSSLSAARFLQFAQSHNHKFNEVQDESRNIEYKD